MLIHPGHLALFRAEMALEFASIKGIKNKFFGDSLLLAQITGPGHIWLQSMTPAKLAAAIEPYLPDKSSGSSFGNDNDGLGRPQVGRRPHVERWITTSNTRSPTLMRPTAARTGHRSEPSQSACNPTLAANAAANRPTARPRGRADGSARARQWRTPVHATWPAGESRARSSSVWSRSAIERLCSSRTRLQGGEAHPGGDPDDHTDSRVTESPGEDQDDHRHDEPRLLDQPDHDHRYGPQALQVVVLERSGRDRTDHPSGSRHCRDQPGADRRPPRPGCGVHQDRGRHHGGTEQQQGRRVERVLGGDQRCAARSGTPRPRRPGPAARPTARSAGAGPPRGRARHRTASLHISRGRSCRGRSRRRPWGRRLDLTDPRSCVARRRAARRRGRAPSRATAPGRR